MRADQADDWKLWLEMARESKLAARSAEDLGLLRSALSRYYYSAYQAATAVLLYRKQNPPEQREAWSHAETPEILEENLRSIISSKDKRKDLSARLKRLYKVRIQADYIASDFSLIDAAIARARRDAGHILNVAESILPQE